jgi:hypothetical protein
MGVAEGGKQKQKSEKNHIRRAADGPLTGAAASAMTRLDERYRPAGQWRENRSRSLHKVVLTSKRVSASASPARIFRKA